MPFKRRRLAIRRAAQYFRQASKSPPSRATVASCFLIRSRCSGAKPTARTWRAWMRSTRPPKGRPRKPPCAPRDVRAGDRRPVRGCLTPNPSHLTAQEEANVRLTLAYLHARVRRWKAVGRAIRSKTKNLIKVRVGRRINDMRAMAGRIARVVAVPAEDIIAGRFPPAGTCPPADTSPSGEEPGHRTRSFVSSLVLHLPDRRFRQSRRVSAAVSSQIPRTAITGT